MVLQRQDLSYAPSCLLRENQLFFVLRNKHHTEERKDKRTKRNGDILSKIAVSFWLRAVIMIKMR